MGAAQKPAPQFVKVPRVSATDLLTLLYFIIPIIKPSTPKKTETIAKSAQIRTLLSGCFNAACICLKGNKKLLLFGSIFKL